MAYDHDPVLPEVEAFLADRGMAPATFGKLAANDPRLVFQLRLGRELRRATRDRIRQFIAVTSGTGAAEGQRGAERSDQEAA